MTPYCYKITPFDLHVLSTPPAFVLSQNQTLRKVNCVWLLPAVAYKTTCWPAINAKLVTETKLPLRDSFLHPVDWLGNRCAVVIRAAHYLTFSSLRNPRFPGPICIDPVRPPRGGPRCGRRPLVRVPRGDPGRLGDRLFRLFLLKIVLRFRG